MHTYEAVPADLRTYCPLVKDDGFLCGHDYANHPGARRAQFGVVEAVNDFVRESGCHIMALTDEAFPNHVLAKRRHSAAAQALQQAILDRFRFIKIYGITGKQFQQEVHLRDNGKPKVYATF